MTETANPVRAAYYADQASVLQTEIIENIAIAKDTYRLRFACPDIAKSIVPGQFVMLKAADLHDPLLARPLAMFDLIRDKQAVPFAMDVVYLVHGKLTSLLKSFEPGQKLEVWGPLGNGFTFDAIDHLIMVAGGIGQTPFLSLAKEALGIEKYGQPNRSVKLAKKITFCYGARTKDYHASVNEFEKLGIDVKLSTDDGSVGHHGLVTDLLTDTLSDTPKKTQIVCCGPEPMMQAVAEIAQAKQVSCQVSLETPMACGIGICFSCVTKVIQEDGEWDYKRTCVDGPIFDSEKIVW